MDVNTLRVFNELHKLGISEEEFLDLENEQKQINHTGLYIRVVKKGHAVCVSHDEKHSIIIKEISKDLPTPSRILFKTLITFQDLPQEVYNLHNIAQYRALDTDIKNTANNLEELKDKIIDRFRDRNYELGTLYADYDTYVNYTEREKVQKQRNILVEEQLSNLFWLFNEDMTSFKKQVKYARPNISRIIKVFEMNNRRIAIIQRTDDYTRKRGCGMMGGAWTEQINGTKLFIRSFKPSNKEYNYVDVNREIYLPTDYGEKLEVWIADDLFEKCGFEELKIISKKYEEDEASSFVLLNADSYNKGQAAVRLAVMSAKREALEDKAKKQLVHSLEEQFKKGKVVRQGITMTRDYLECEGIRISNKRIGEFIAINQVHLLTEPDFNKIIQDFFLWILSIKVYNDHYMGRKPIYFCEFKGHEEIKVNKVNIVLEARGNNVFLNNCRVNKDDIREVVLKAIRYSSQEEFDAYAKMCSTINLELQDALNAGGLSFALKIDNTPDNSLSKWNKDSDMLLALPLKRINNKNYVTISGKEYKVKDTQALFDLGKNIDSTRLGMSGGGYLQRSIKLLYRAVEGITPKEIGDVIKNGVKEYEALVRAAKKEEKEKIERSKELLVHAVKVSKAKRIKGGYLVKGVSGQKYTVADNLATYEVRGKNPKVIKEEHSRYVCIVDLETDTSTSWGLNDALAKRLLMLRHDEKVAGEIHTLGLNNDEEVET